jgi:uncharacterized membrane protein
MAEGDTLVNVVVGAVATVALSGVIPFSPLFGGGIAGYLQGGDRSEGLRVGAISGVVAFVPVAAVGLLVFVFVVTAFVGGAASGAPRAFGAFGALTAFGGVLVGFLSVVYIVGLSALGGWLGNYVKYDTDFEV